MLAKQFYKTLNILNFLIHSPYITKTYSLCDLALGTALALIHVSSYFSWRKEELMMLILTSPNSPAFYGNQTHLLSSLFCRHWESRDPPQFPRCFLGGRSMGDACRIQTSLAASSNLHSLPCFCDLSLSVSLTPCSFPKAALTKDCWVSSQLFIKKNVWGGGICPT